MLLMLAATVSASLGRPDVLVVLTVAKSRPAVSLAEVSMRRIEVQRVSRRLLLIRTDILQSC